MACGDPRACLAVAAGALAAVLGLIALYCLLQWVVPKIAAIAWATGKEAVSQPLFYLVIGAGVALLALSVFLPYFTFGEDVKVVEENGLTLVMLMAITT